MFPSKKVCQVERGKQLVVDVVVPACRKLFSPPLYQAGCETVREIKHYSRTEIVFNVIHRA